MPLGFKLKRGMPLALKKNKLNYKKSGVNVDGADAFVEWIQLSHSKNQSHRGQVVSGIGGFSALFRPQWKKWKKPLLVSSTDGVGTKILLAIKYNNYRRIGQDLVAMCVNDLLTCGAEPLFFLDYYATGKLKKTQSRALIKSIRDACDQVGCVLIGGETAEMPGLYRGKDFDCAGFILGMVDEEKLLGSHLVKKDDIILGFASSGFHSNGYSLLRQVFKKDMARWSGELLKPTRLYHELVSQTQSKVHAYAHITGGGIENIPRVLPQGLGFQLQPWIFPKAFLEVQQRTGMDNSEMMKTLNCGIGFVAILPKKNLNFVQAAATRLKIKTYTLGTLEKVKSSQAPIEF